jgi:hypothetical protein
MAMSLGAIRRDSVDLSEIAPVMKIFPISGSVSQRMPAMTSTNRLAESSSIN